MKTKFKCVEKYYLPIRKNERQFEVKPFFKIDNWSN